MKDHQRTQARRTAVLPPGGNQPMPQNTFVAGESVVRVSLTAKVVRVTNAGNGRLLLKLDTAPDGQPDQGQWVQLITDLGDEVQIEVL